MVFFDVDGTLVERALDPLEGARRTLAAAGFSELNPIPALLAVAPLIDEAWPRWRSPEEEEEGWREIAGLFAARLGAPVPVELVLGGFRHYSPWFRPIPGVVALLEALRERGERLAVISNWPPSLERFLGELGLDGFFEAITGSGAAGVAKPDAAIFQRALEAARVSPGEATYVGNDWLIDVVPARRLGLRAILLDREGVQPDAEPPRAQSIEELSRLLLPE